VPGVNLHILNRRRRHPYPCCHLTVPWADPG
jgi:hypothetical protein